MKVFYSIVLALFIPLFLFAQNKVEDRQKKEKDHYETLFDSLPEIVIHADKRLNVSYLDIKGDEVPMTINVMDKKSLRELNITSVGDVAMNIPGMQPLGQYGAFQFFNIRGFDNFVVLNNGFRDERHNIAQSAPLTNLANVERVEVLKGPTGEFFGHSALGGIINIVKKRPTREFTGNTSLTLGSYNTRNVIIGAGGSITDKLRFRFDVGINDTDGWRDANVKTNNYSGVLQYLINRRTQLELSMQYNDDLYGADPGIPTDDNGEVVEPFDYKTNYGDRNERIKNKSFETQLRFTHRFSKDSKLTNILAYSHDDIDYLMREVLFYNPKTKKVGLNNPDYHFQNIVKPISNQLNYNISFNTGNVRHKAMIGNTTTYLDWERRYKNIERGDLITNSIDNFIAPGEVRPSDIALQRNFKETVVGTYIHDWMEFTDRFRVLIGARYNYFSGEYSRGKAGSEDYESHDDEFHNFSYRVGLSYQAKKNLNLFASASNYFKPARLAHHGKTVEPFDPETGFQTEVGLKLSNQRNYNVVLSGYFIEKSNMLVGHQKVSQVGGAQSKGIELDADWNITKQLFVKVGYALTDSKFIKKGQSEEDQDIIGKKTPWTPQHSFNSWVNYEFDNCLKGLGIGAGVYFTDKTYQNPTNTQSLPSYTIANAALYYNFNNNIRLGVNVENIFDKLYMKSSLSSNDLWTMEKADEPYQSKMQAYPGRGRNLQVTLSYDF